jgi:hypothetical protein
MKIKDMLKLEENAMLGEIANIAESDDWVTVKTVRSMGKYQLPNDDWVQQAIIADETGEINAEIVHGKTIRYMRNWPIRILDGWINEKLLFISKFETRPSVSEPPEDSRYGYNLDMGDNVRVARSKIKHGHSVAFVTAYLNNCTDNISGDEVLRETYAFVSSPVLDEIVDVIMKG